MKSGNNGNSHENHRKHGDNEEKEEIGLDTDDEDYEYDERNENNMIAAVQTQNTVRSLITLDHMSQCTVKYHKNIVAKLMVMIPKLAVFVKYGNTAHSQFLKEVYTFITFYFLLYLLFLFLCTFLCRFLYFHHYVTFSLSHLPLLSTAFPPCVLLSSFISCFSLFFFSFLSLSFIFFFSHSPLSLPAT